MAYNTWKGDAALGDVVNQDDIDTLIDWDENTITLKTNNTARLVVDNSSVSGSGDLEFAGNTYLGGTLNVTGTSTFTGVSTHIGHPVFNSGITIKNADASAGYINFYEQSSNGTNVCTFRGKSSMGNCTITLPGQTGTVVLLDDTVTLSNKTIATPTLTGVTTAAAISASSTLQAVGATTLGSTLNVSGAATMAGTVSVAQKIEHAGDTDTYIEFTTDSVEVKAGNESMIIALEGAGGDQADKVAINNGATDVDFQVKGTSALVPNLIRTDAANNRVGIGHGAGNLSGSATLTVIGAISGSSTLEAVGATTLGSTLSVSGAVTLAGPASGSLAGPSSYLGVTAAGVLILTASGGGISFNGSTANGLVTYGGATQADVEANMTFDGSTLTVTGDSTIDKNHSATAEATVTGLQIDFDKTGTSTTNNTMYGLNIDMDNATATDGLNTMYGLHVTPTLTHAANAGVPVVYGALINAQGGTNGTSIVQAVRLEAGGGDLNYGIQLDVEDGGVDLRIESSADSGDYFQIQTTTHGATTITTVDDDATAADLTFTVDGDINLNPAGGDVLVGGNISGSGTLQMVGNAFLGGTLNVTGGTTLAGDITATGDTNTFSSVNSTDPLVVIKNTTNDAKSARLRFVMDKGAAGAADDEAGVIEFFADDANQDNICFASVTGSVAVHTNGQEGGKLTLRVASNDGEQQPGLVIQDGNAEDEVDVTIGNGVDSLVSIAGDMALLYGAFAVGSDASGDMYYRNDDGILARIAVGSDNHVLTLNGVVPGWEAVPAPVTFTNLSGSGTLQAVGAVTLGSTLNVTGAITAAGNLKGAAISGSGDLQMVGVAKFGNALHVSGSPGNVASIGLGTTAVHTTATHQISIANGVQPQFATADQISLGAKDSTGLASDGATFALQTECLVQNTALDAVGTLSHRITIWHNGTEYYLYLDPV